MRKTKSVTTTEIKQGIKLAPQQIILANLIQASTEDLARLIDQELEKNVALETDETRSVDEMTEAEGVANDDVDDELPGDADLPDEHVTESDDVKDLPDAYADDDGPLPVADRRDPNKEDYSPLTNYGADTSFREALKEQLAMLELSERDMFIASYLVESLEDDGYLRRPLADLVSALAWNQNFDTTEQELERVLLEVVQANLEPVGVGARDLRECLLLQLDEMSSSPAAMKARQVLDEAFADFMKRRFEIIKENFDFTDRDIDDIRKVVHRLNPKPGGETSATDAIATKAAVIRPDFHVTNEGGELVVSLYNSRVPAVRISPDYSQMLQAIDRQGGSEEERKKGRSFIEGGIRAGNIFIAALIMRRNTLIKVMRAIARFQYNYFVSGNIEDLKPMTLRQIAELTTYDISTISRACSNRYVQTDYDIIALRSLFTSAVAAGRGGKVVSNSVIKNALRDIVDAEDKSQPLTDDELLRRLAAQGYTIARRTVVKYRQLLGIQKAELRKL